ncbi:MAG TPA: hypothetical protein VKA19_11295, partial [Alphaproteobacteria bacterium]|nr:hypothetical protein [Alphaproteobacteria bacterium]
MPRPKRDLPWLDLREGVYYAFWYNETKRRTDRLSLRTQDRQTALDRFAAFLTSGIDGVKPPTAGTTIDEVLDNYDTEHLQRASVNHAKHVSTLVNLRAHFGPVDVSDVDIPMCRRYADRRRAGDIGWSNASPATVRKELTILIAALHHAVKWKRLKRDDVPYIERPPISESRLRWLSHNELD